MKRFAIILTLCGLLLSILACKQAKEGPFTFTNKTDSSVNVIIQQDKAVELSLAANKVHTGVDYFTPEITFVEDFTSRKILNTYTAITPNGFDYTFIKATPSNISISLKIPSNMASSYPDYKDWYIEELNKKLGEDSSESKIIFSTFESTASIPDKLYTDSPDFKVFDAKGKDISSSFTIKLEKGAISPGIWKLEIIYPKEDLNKGPKV